MKTIDIIERIEGEASLHLSWQNQKISDAQISFLNFRGFETILQNKPILDALVYTPRICGICGQAHLYATVKALENLYENANISLPITSKADSLRQLGLMIEIIQSHIKWFYFYILPDINQSSKYYQSKYEPLKGKQWLKAQKASSQIVKALALFAGQWPHSSYMIPGGVVSDPMLMEMQQVENYIDEAITFFEKEMTGVGLDEYLSFSKQEDLNVIQADIHHFIKICYEQNLHDIGQSYNRFIVLSDTLGFHQGKRKIKNINRIDYEKIKEFESHTFSMHEKNQNSNQKYTWAKSVEYNGLSYETGPLARAIISNNEFMKSIHRTYNDTVLTRVFARVNEIALLCAKAKQLLNEININEPSFIAPSVELKTLQSAVGTGVVEAARGSLKHTLRIKNGMIEQYDVITPTVWNLGPGNNEKQGIAQKAIIGAKSTQEAMIILRSFDVCSVCTTH
jgi:hydrogenase large subunit